MIKGQLRRIHKSADAACFVSPWWATVFLVGRVFISIQLSPGLTPLSESWSNSTS